VASEMLRRDGDRVDTATDGVDALARLRAHAYDTVISDVKMPGLDGIELWNTVKRDDPALVEAVHVGRHPSRSGSRPRRRASAPRLPPRPDAPLRERATRERGIIRSYGAPSRPGHPLSSTPRRAAGGGDRASARRGSTL